MRHTHWCLHVNTKCLKTFSPFDIFPLIAISVISVTVSQFQKLFHYYWCLNSTYEWHNSLIVCVCLTKLLSRISYRCTHVAKQAVFPPFFNLVILHCTCGALLLSPLHIGWIFSLLPYVGGSKQSCTEHGAGCVFSMSGFQQRYSQVWDCLIIG